jgi:hypothetical protein
MPDRNVDVYVFNTSVVKIALFLARRAGFPTGILL